MPLRLIREGILTSDRVEKLSHAEEVFYRRLMSVVDDYGRFDARPSVLRSALYPLRIDKTREADIERSLAACQEAVLLRLYTVAGKPYLEMLDFRQVIRAKKSKYPDPPPDLHSTCIADAQQPLADAILDGFGDGDDKRSRGAGAPLPFASEKFAEAWVRWKDYRRALGKPLNEITQAQQLREIKPLGEARAIRMIDHTIGKGWVNLREGEPASGESKEASSNDVSI